jgi:hypothetical protein
MVVADEMESAVLRGNCGFLVNGAVFESVHRARRQPVAMDELNDLAATRPSSERISRKP